MYISAASFNNSSVGMLLLYRTLLGHVIHKTFITWNHCDLHLCRSCLLYLWYWGSFDTLLVDRGLTVVLLVLCFGFLSCMFTLPLCCWWNGSCQLWHWGAVSDFTRPVSSSCNQCYKDFGLCILYACTVVGLILHNLALADQIIQCYICSYNVTFFHTME